MFTNEGAGGAYTSSVWGIIIFLLILFWVFGNRNGMGFGAPGAGAMCWGNNEHTPKDNDARLTDIKATMDKDTAVLTGQLETAFRQVINQSNVNTDRVIDGQREQYIRTLERENFKLFSTAQTDQLKYAMLGSNAELNRRLDGIECQMLKRPPVYPQVCVPCSSSLADGGCGCGCGSV